MKSVSLTLYKRWQGLRQCRYFFPLTCLARARGGIYTAEPRNLYEMNSHIILQTCQG